VRATDVVTLVLIMLERALEFIRPDAPPDVIEMKDRVADLKKWRDEEIAAEWRIVKTGQP
jgi:hypothetical protein